MKFEQTPGVNKNPKWKYYTKIGLLALISLLSRGESKAQSGPQKSTPAPVPTVDIDVGKGTYKDPWKYKLPKTEEDPIVQERERNKLNETTPAEAELTIITKREKQKNSILNKIEILKQKTQTTENLDKIKELEESLEDFDEDTDKIVKGELYIDEEFEKKEGNYAKLKKDKKK